MGVMRRFLALKPMVAGSFAPELKPRSGALKVFVHASLGSAERELNGECLHFPYKSLYFRNVCISIDSFAGYGADFREQCGEKIFLRVVPQALAILEEDATSLAARDTHVSLFGLARPVDHTTHDCHP